MEIGGANNGYKFSFSVWKFEFGDLLFSLINYARFLQVDAEAALERTNKKFMYRFQEMEKMAAEKGLQLANMSLEAMDELWNEIKKKK